MGKTDFFADWCEKNKATSIIRFSTIRPKFNGMGVLAVAKANNWICMFMSSGEIVLLEGKDG